MPRKPERRRSPLDGEHLAEALAPRAWHRDHCSASSSQVLAIALLAAATCADSTLSWVPGESRFRNPITLFEVELAPAVLKERPRQTAIDWLVLDRHGVMAAEAKFTEPGFGQCSCKHRSAGRCSKRVLERPYWEVASRDLGLERDSATRCDLGLADPGRTNVAAAEAIAGGRKKTTLLRSTTHAIRTSQVLVRGQGG